MVLLGYLKNNWPEQMLFCISRLGVAENKRSLLDKHLKLRMRTNYKALSISYLSKLFTYNK